MRARLDVRSYQNDFLGVLFGCCRWFDFFPFLFLFLLDGMIPRILKHVVPLHRKSAQTLPHRGSLPLDPLSLRISVHHESYQEYFFLLPHGVLAYRGYCSTSRFFVEIGRTGRSSHSVCSHTSCALRPCFSFFIFFVHASRWIPFARALSCSCYALLWLSVLCDDVAQVKEGRMWDSSFRLLAALQVLYTRLQILLHATVDLPWLHVLYFFCISLAL